MGLISRVSSRTYRKLLELEMDRPKSVSYQEKVVETPQLPPIQDENNFSSIKNSHFEQCFKDYHLNQRPLSATGIAHTQTRLQKDDVEKNLTKIRPITANVMNPLISTRRKPPPEPKIAENYFGPIPTLTETIRPASLHQVEDTTLHVHSDLIRKLNIENSQNTEKFSKEHIKVEELISLPQLREINRHFTKFDGSLNLKQFSEVIL